MYIYKRQDNINIHRMESMESSCHQWCSSCTVLYAKCTERKEQTVNDVALVLVGSYVSLICDTA